MAPQLHCSEHCLNLVDVDVEGSCGVHGRKVLSVGVLDWKSLDMIFPIVMLTMDVIVIESAEAVLRRLQIGV